jgi:hypothetical protein
MVKNHNTDHLKELYIYGLIGGTPFKDELEKISVVQENTPIYGVWHKNIGFAVSAAPDYPLKDLSKESIIQLFVHHQQVLECLRQKFSLIPVKLGTVLESVTEAAAVLANNEEKFNDLLNYLKDKVELNLSVSWNDLNEVVAKIGEEDEVKKLKQSLLAQEQVSQEDLIKIGKIISFQMQQKKQAAREYIISELRNLWEDYFINEVVDENSILNLTLLAITGKVDDVNKKIEYLNQIYRDSLDFSLTKSLLPQGFSTVSIKKITMDQLLLAKDILKLPDTASLQDINAARRALLHCYHPDKNDHAAVNKVQEINAAYKLLEEYCQENSSDFNVDRITDYYIMKVIKADKSNVNSMNME